MTEGKLNGLDLFSGVGGLSRALEPWVETVAYCERDEYAQSVLLSRMLSGDLDAAPIWDDVTTLRGADLPGIDVIFGGFPCQDVSIAGRGEGLEGKRSGLFFEIARLVDEIKPALVFLENVPAIRTRGLGDVVRTLTALGYDCRWSVVSAEEVGAPHLRKRWFLLAADTERLSLWDRTERRPGRRKGELRAEGQAVSLDDGETQSLANPSCRWSWRSEPNVGRVAHGVPFRVDRIRCLGNAVVPLQAQEAFKELMGLNT